LRRARDDFVEEALELAVTERDAIQGLELLAEIFLERGPIADVRAAFVLQPSKFDYLHFSRPPQSRSFRSARRGEPA
jgi:hypothetical protein